MRVIVTTIVIVIIACLMKYLVGYEVFAGTVTLNNSLNKVLRYVLIRSCLVSLGRQ